MIQPGLIQRTFLLLTSSLLCFALNGQITWLEASEVASSDFGNKRPRMVVDGNGNPMIAWGNTGNAMFTRWTGTGFMDPVRLNPDTVSIAEANWMGVDIAASGDSVYIVYKETPEDDPTNHVWCTVS